MLAFWISLRRAQRAHTHHYPHFECTAERTVDRCEDDDPALNKPAIGHVCSCECRRCTLIAHDADGHKTHLCICPGCDAHACGLHSSAVPSTEGG